MSARTKRWARISVAVVLLLGAVVFVAGFFNVFPPPDLTKEIFQRPEIRVAFATAQSATVQRLQPKEPYVPSPVLANYARGPEITVPAATVKKLQTLFQKRSSFAWNRVKSCMPDYGVLFTFHSPRGDVQLALCFHCGQFAVFDGDSVVNAEEDFDPIYSRLTALVKPLFPEDKALQELR